MWLQGIAAYPNHYIVVHRVTVLSLFTHSTVGGQLGYFQFESLKILQLGTFLCVFWDICIGLSTLLKPYTFLMK